MRDGQTKTVTGTLSDYYMAPVEVSNKLWATVMGQKPEGQTNDGDMYPVSMVNYYDIAGPDGFLARLNAMVKDQLPVGKQLALPTEAQWQYAAMGGKLSKGYKYSGSNTLSDVAWYKDNADGTTHTIGQKQANELGLHDMTGNVWEWTRDNSLDMADLPAQQGTDYVALDGSAYRITRGGGIQSTEAGCESANSDGYFHQTSKNIGVGLRLALVDAYTEDVPTEPTANEHMTGIRIYSSDGSLSDFIWMCDVQGGDYSMQYERDGQTKTVTGTLSDYMIGWTEVTNQQWHIVMGTKPEGQTKSGGFYPVSNVTYEEITKEGGFLDKLNALVADQLPAGMKFMLPTEAQWHYAAQGGQKSKGYTYAGSNTLSDVAWYLDNAGGTTHPVASKQPNELGLYDMSGNVWEYCSDWWADTADLPAEQGTDYAGPSTGTLRVNLGGSFKSATSSMPVMLRDYLTPDAPAADKVVSRGLRLVLAVPSDNYSATDSAPAAAEAVDLGLPSGTKWANMNVGAEKPEDYGLYFAWGDTVGYGSDTGDGHNFRWGDYKWSNGYYNALTKYCTDSAYGLVDNKTVLDPEDDAVRVNWGGKWRMPNKAELDELFTQCTWTWQADGNTAYNGVAGYKVTGSNGNSIFLPAAGYRYGTASDDIGTHGYYWTASLGTVYPYCAYSVFFRLENVNGRDDSRHDAFTVRAVQ